MKANFEAEKIGPITDRLRAAKAVLSAAHLPSMAVAEVARQLRGLAMDLEPLADDVDEAQRAAARGPGA